MDSNRTVWQIGCGSGPRLYADIFLKYGVGLIGPGDSGEWNAERAERSDSDFSDEVRQFANDVSEGDVFILRKGVSTIIAIGLVASEYMYKNQFDDVCGWDLQHTRRVRWCKLPKSHTFDGQVFGARPSRVSRTKQTQVLDYAERFLNSPPTHWQSAPLPELPAEEPTLDEVPDALQGVIALVQDLVPIFWDRQGFGEHPTEDELVAHLVVPFLRALGWPQERIGVKWRYIDVSLFSALPRSPENCRFVIEAKRLGAGVEGALEQAKGYVQSLELQSDIIVTDGVRYRLYSSQNNFESVAYANLVRLKQSALNLFNIIKRK